MDFYLQILMFLAVFGLILFLSFYTTRFVGAKAGRLMKGKHIRIIETVSLGVDKKLHLVKAGNKFLLLSSCGKQVSLISQVDIKLEEGDEKTAEMTDIERFKSNLGRLKSLVRRTKEKGEWNWDEDSEKD